MNVKTLPIAALAVTVIAAALSGCSVAEAAAPGGKVAYVDIGTALLTVSDGKKAKAALKKKFEEKQKLLDAKKAAFEKATAALEKKKAVLTPTAMKAEEEKLQKEFLELNTLYQNLQNELAEQEKKLTEPILIRFEAILAKMGEDGGYTMIMPASAILWAPAYLDLTTELIRKYEAGGGKDALKKAKAGKGKPKPKPKPKPKK